MLLVIMAVAMMTTTDRLAQLINKLNKSWRKDAKKAIAYLQRLLSSGMKFEEALDNVQRHYGKLFTLPGLRPALVEAAACAYGIVPSVLTTAQVKLMGEQLAGKWDESGMTLSEKLHGVGVKMRGAIVSTLQEQMRRNKTWTEAARALYDGYGEDGQNVYNGGKDIISRQELPKYLQKVRMATGNDLQALAEQRQAIDKINRLARNGAPNKALQAAYNELMEAVQKGNEKAIEKAVEVAVNEKSRYVAERITRTEMARAWADGFIAKMQKDADIVAVKFKLSSRHPVFDICDMYAKADMYGLGAGIYPKDKLPPLPVHPHCLCRYVEVIEGEVDMQQQRDQVREAGDKWLNSLPESRRAQVLGRDGLKAWKDGEDWRKYMRGYAGLREAESRLSDLSAGAISGALNDKNDPDYTRRYEHAEKYYEARRKNGIHAFVNKIHKNTGYPKKRLESIFKHVFINEYDLADGHHRFYPNFEMSQSFQRLLEGKNIQEHDVLMLKHEHLEFAIMKKIGYNYDEAHDLTNTKYNYSLAERYWREKNVDA
ncbi:hypothetical protein [Phascolarctobacterium succinatutens]|uniref:hypothetical protein n=1 Tax=Phascolarctobacterium succinatutens TaxID=626940 RepID=UPI0023F69A40|nr:hypothetical protein [Phascolarctobacterium succinatutens]